MVHRLCCYTWNSSLTLTNSPPQEIVEKFIKKDEYKPRVDDHRVTNPNDPVPIPVGTPEPQVWIPVSEGRPWHCQIHRDAFNYGSVAEEIDGRLIVDLRWFGMMTPEKTNRVKFETDVRDRFGMPQPTFQVTINKQDSNMHHAMLKDMTQAALCMGGFLPGVEPAFQQPGLSLHISVSLHLSV